MQLLSSCWTGVVPSGSILSALAIQKESLLAPPVVIWLAVLIVMGNIWLATAEVKEKLKDLTEVSSWYPKAASIYPINFIYPNQASKGQGHGFWRTQSFYRCTMKIWCTNEKLKGKGQHGFLACKVFLSTVTGSKL